MKGMTIIVKKTSQLIAGMVFMYGIYVIVHGHLTPGGGFAGGVIIAGSFILVTLAYGGDFLKLVKEENRTTIVESLATILVITIAVSGFLFGTKIFFKIFSLEPRSQLQYL
jgi:multicomponent Na+:H+ antiporter subunit B